MTPTNQWVIKQMKDVFNQVVLVNEIGSESIVLEREELDKRLLPHYGKELRLSELLLVHLYEVMQQENHYQVYILADEENGQWQLVGFIKNGSLMHSYVVKEVI